MIFDIKSEGDLHLVREALRGRKVGLTSGSYDLFHHLHLVYLKRCRRLCDILVVGVDSDDLVRNRKGPGRPVIPEHQRVSIVSDLTCVGAAFILGSVEGFGEAVSALRPNLIFKNDAFDEGEILGRELAELVILPDIIQFSSTSEIFDEIARRVSMPVSKA